jgi:hypothetical protein
VPHSLERVYERKRADRCRFGLIVGLPRDARERLLSGAQSFDGYTRYGSFCDMRRASKRSFDGCARRQRVKGAVADYARSLALDAAAADAWIDRATPLWRLDRGSDAVASCLEGLKLSDTPRHRSTCTVVVAERADRARMECTVRHYGLG